MALSFVLVPVDDRLPAIMDISEGTSCCALLCTALMIQ